MIVDDPLDEKPSIKTPLDQIFNLCIRNMAEEVECSGYRATASIQRCTNAGYGARVNQADFLTSALVYLRL